MKKFAKIEDIAAELTLDLEARRFKSIDPIKHEKLRYKKIDSPTKFQVGIEENFEDEEEPSFNHINLVMGLNLTKDINDFNDERVYPSSELMYQFFRNSSIYYYQLGFNKDIFRGGKMNSFYHIGFDKSKTSVEEMNRILTEVIDYFCNYTTTNIEMLKKTRVISQSKKSKPL